MSDRGGDFKDLCSNILTEYLSLSYDALGVEERGGGTDKKAGSPATSPSTLDRQRLVQRLMEHQVVEEQAATVPQHLPESMRDRPEELRPYEMRELYDLDSSLQQVQSGTLSTIDVIVLHLRSYRNILDMQLSDMDGLRQRFVGYFQSIFMEVMDRCFRDQPTTDSVVARMWDELRRNRRPHD